MSKDIAFPVSGSPGKALTTKFFLSLVSVRTIGETIEDNGGNGDKTIGTYSFRQLLPWKFHFVHWKDQEFFVSKIFPSLTLRHTLLQHSSKEEKSS